MVFPAHAGMSLTGISDGRVNLGFPRPRGDEPGYGEDYVREVQFSPPTRG